MGTIISETPVWRTKEGEIPISSMTDKHLQKAYNTAEYRYKKYMNQSTSSSLKAAMLEKIIRHLEKEAFKRNFHLISLSSKDGKDVEILNEEKSIMASLK